MLPYISGGILGYDLKVISWSKDLNKNFEEFKIPAGSKTVFQDMGKQSTSLKFNCFDFSSNKVRQLEDWYNSGNSLCVSGGKFYLSGGIITDFSSSEPANPGTYPYNFNFTIKEV